MSPAENSIEEVILIAGPTASGKTSMALEIAAETPSIIMNADSMQVYRDLCVITARPSEAEMQACPHKLFGHVDGAVAYSVAQWLAEAGKLLSSNDNRRVRKIIVGGTGLYFNSLLSGISAVPEIPLSIREKWRNLAQNDAGSLYPALQEVDPVMAERLLPSDSQRIARALEVFESTGTSIADWQKKAGAPLVSTGAGTRKILLMPDRQSLHERINDRFDVMMQEGAVEEVEGLVARKLDPGLPVMKAIGVPQISSFLAGEISRHEAVERSKAASRQYAKRQCTWFRNSFDDGWEVIS